MADETPTEDLMQYEAMAQEALRGVIKTALRKVTGGMPGDHHFYITFKTGAPGVEGPPELLGKYPDEMTIVIQHQYWDLAAGETFFSVMLKFGGTPRKLSIPYAAITRFYDPSVQFLLQFETQEPAFEEEADAEAEADGPAAKADPPEGGAEVVSLDHFRKK
ncbi:MAG: hypothetical protein JWP35_613 [Caulobacter sp.]|nr:hypothetical protein [Caulobacter sp.]